MSDNIDKHGKFKWGSQSKEVPSEKYYTCL